MATHEQCTSTGCPGQESCPIKKAIDTIRNIPIDSNDGVNARLMSYAHILKRLRVEPCQKAADLRLHADTAQVVLRRMRPVGYNFSKK